MQLASPQVIRALAIVLGAWGVSHLVGAGEIVDVILVGVGLIALGREALDVIGQFSLFVRTAVSATSDRDLDRAAQLFADTVSRAGIDVVVILVTHRAASAARAATSGIAASAQVTASIERLQPLIDDPEGLLARLSLEADSASKAKQLASFVESLEREVPKFKGKPKLRLTRLPESWERASDTFVDDAAPKQPHVQERLTGRTLTAYEQGAYLTRTSSRSGSAVLPGWNRMNIVEHQELPPGSIVLEGPAAPQAPGGAWSKGGAPVAGGDLQAFHAGQLTSAGKLLPRAIRDVVGGTTVGPSGRPGLSH